MNFDREEVLVRLQAVFDRVFAGKIALSESLSARDVPEWTSLVHVSLLVAVERAFGIRFLSGEIEKAQNVGEMIDMVVSKLKPGSVD